MLWLSTQALTYTDHSINALAALGRHLRSQGRPGASIQCCAGTAHIVAVLLVLSRLAFVLGGCRFRRYRLRSLPFIMQCTAAAAAALCLLVELFQLNARIASDPSPLIDGEIAPFEWAGEACSSLLH